MAADVARVAAMPRLAPRAPRRAPTRRAPAPARSHAPHGDAAAAALVAWLREDGASVSHKLAVNAYAPGGLRGVVAAADIEAGEVVIDLPASCSCFSAEAARDELPLGVGQALRAASVPCGDDAALALWLAAAACAPAGLSPLSPYAAALPAEAPDLPSRWPPEQAEVLLPFSMDAALAEDAQAADESLAQAAAAAARLPSPLPLERLEWAWAHVRARAIRFQARAACARCFAEHSFADVLLAGALRVGRQLDVEQVPHARGGQPEP